MVSIGIRVSPTLVTYAIVRGTPAAGFTLVQADTIHVPAALETPRQLQFVRTALLDVIEEHAALRAGLRLTESNARQKNPFRLNLEGVVQELLASSDVEQLVAGPIATIASLLGERDRTVIKRMIAGERVPSGALQWGELGPEEREATLVAMAAASAPASHGLVAPPVQPDGGSGAP